MKKIAAVVVTYNRKDLLLNCIQCILKQENISCDILVVDNASTDGTESAVMNQPSDRVYYRNTGSNLGGAGGFQFGIRWAVEEGYSLIWLMDDDTAPTPLALWELVNAYINLIGKCGFLASEVLWKDGALCQMNLPKRKKGKGEIPGLIPVSQATFVSLLLPSSVVMKVGLPIKEFFIWGDDIEYTRRISVRRQYPCYQVTQSKVIHLMETNKGSNLAIDDETRIERYRYAYRNECYTYRQEGLFGRLFYLVKCGWNILRILRKAPNQRGKRCKVILESMKDGIRFNPEVEFIQNN